MRPVERGPWPVDDNGNPVSFSDYPKARGDLIERLGEYCSYCGMHLDSSLAVEHVKPKKDHPHLRRDWGNFLLSCTNCNSTKGTKNIILGNYYWPDIDNTFLAFEYLTGGRIQAASGLSQVQKDKADATLKLTGLDKTPLNNPAASDRRWLNRAEAWDIAKLALKRLIINDCKAMREQIADTARANGYWSIWMTVFHQDSDMLQRFIKAFPGTCNSCFDSQSMPISRNPNGL